MKQARNNYNIAADVFGIAEESDEEDHPERRSLIKKKNVHRSCLPASYYRDIAQIKEKRDLIKKNKKKNRNAKSDAGHNLSDLGILLLFNLVKKNIKRKEFMLSIN